MLDKIEERLLPIPEMLIDEQMRFWGSVKRLGPDDCWNWTGSKADRGYGQIRINRRNYTSTRVAYYLTYGEPGPIRVLHDCNNNLCCNPKHLYLGTQSQNMKQRHLDGRYDSRGSLNSRAKFYDSDIIKIRKLGQTQTAAAIAKHYGVGPSSIEDILNYVTYAQINASSV